MMCGSMLAAVNIDFGIAQEPIELSSDESNSIVQQLSSDESDDIPNGPTTSQGARNVSELC